MSELHAEGLASIAAYARVSLGRRGRGVLDDGGVVACAGSSPVAGPYTNHGLRVDPSVPAGEAFARMVGFFGALGHGFAVTTDDRADADLVEVLKAHGASVYSERSAPGMVVESPVDPSPVASAVSVVDGQSALDELCEVVGVAYGYGPGLRGFLGPWPIDGSARCFVARDSGRVVASALALRDVGGIYMVGTLPEVRRRGFGEAVTAAATNSLLDDGASAVVLQASAMGEPIYARMGFRTFTTYTQWAIDAAEVPR